MPLEFNNLKLTGERSKELFHILTANDGENALIIWGILCSTFIASSSAGKSEIVVGVMRFLQ